VAIYDQTTWTDAAVDVDTDVQIATFIKAMQQEAVRNDLENYDGWVRSHNDDGTKRATDYYDGEEDFVYWTLVTMLTVVSGSKATHFRRVEGDTLPTDWTDWEDDAYSYGYITAGDIIGPWIFRDLQDVINLKVWTLFDGGTDWTEEGLTDNNVIGQDMDTNWADAKTGAEVAVTAHNGKRPCAFTKGWTEWWDRDYYAVFYRTAMCAYFSGRWEEMPYAVALDWYGMAKFAEGKWDGDEWVVPWPSWTIDFDANGDDVIQDKWSLFDTTLLAEGSATKTSTLTLGSSGTVPTWVADPSIDGKTNVRGWVVPPNPPLGDSRAFPAIVARWERGFQFQW